MKEIWKDIPNYEQLYQVSNIGRVRSKDKEWYAYNYRKKDMSIVKMKGRIMKQGTTNCNYKQVHLSKNGIKKVKSVHRLVAEVFLPNPHSLPQINHIDGNKANNCIENLEWCDNGYNQQHAVATGLKDKSKMSANSSFRKLTEEQVRFIKYQYSFIDTTKRGEKWLFCKIIKALFGLQSENTVLWILNEGTNKFFDENINKNENYDVLLTQYNSLKDLMKPKRTIKSYADELGVNESSFRTRFEMFNRDIDATVNYYKQLRG
jgi:hypothetical protein